METIGREGWGNRELHDDLRIGDTGADLLVWKHLTSVDVHLVYHLHVLTQYRDVLHSYLQGKVINYTLNIAFV